MKKRIKYTDGPIGEVKVVPDSLPPPEKLAFGDYHPSAAASPAGVRASARPHLDAGRERSRLKSALQTRRERTSDRRDVSATA